MSKETDELYYIRRALETREYGQCYVHVGMRCVMRVFDGREYHVSGYGRSLQSGGHKYKVHARIEDKPISTKELSKLWTKLRNAIDCGKEVAQCTT